MKTALFSIMLISSTIWAAGAQASCPSNAYMNNCKVDNVCAAECTNPPSQYFYDNDTGPGSRYYCLNGTGPGTQYYWNNSTGVGSRYYCLNSTGPGSLYYYNNHN